ncbi:MAG: adenylate/guanylate cyclase domain-containing protein [Deltaproteobacteria bacterium]|nr:adenylate/guanylate cyclase domain-containing protein [Deltaproteobacteria bacterium]
MRTAHRIADSCLWGNFIFTAICLHEQQVIGRKLQIAYTAWVVPALLLVLTGSTGDVIQLGTTWPFLITLTLFAVAFVTVARRIPTAERKLAPLGQALGFGVFALAGTNDMFAVTGVTAAPMLLPVGVVGSLLFTAIAVNESIIATYRERDYLRHNLELEVARKTEELRTKSAALAVAHDKAERLLLNVLPRSIADRLREDHRSIADGFESVTVLFADVAGFTPLSEALPPSELVQFLNDLFSKFDQLAEDLGLEKIKTIGDAYMVAGGLPEPRRDHAQAVVQMGLAMAQVAAQTRTPTGQPLQLRIGINTGPVVAGVIGQRKFIYDLWGDTVNLASRMESHGVAGRVQVTEATLRALGGQFHAEPRGEIDVKGKGKVAAFLVVGEVAQA